MRFLVSMEPKGEHDVAPSEFVSVLDSSVLGSDDAWCGNEVCVSNQGFESNEWVEARARALSALGQETWSAGETASVIHVWHHTTDRTAGNYVGNVYFAEYGAWMGAAWESLLHDLDADAEGQHVLKAAESNIDFRVESFPFDSFVCEVSVVALYEGGLVAEFVFRRADLVLAVGRQVYVGDCRSVVSHFHAAPTPTASA